MQNTEADIQIMKSGHETKSEIQQKSGIPIDKPVNNKKIGFMISQTHPSLGSQEMTS